MRCLSSYRSGWLICAFRVNPVSSSAGYQPRHDGGKMHLFLRSFFFGLAALSLAACSSGLVYAPVIDLTQAPLRMKPIRTLQHRSQTLRAPLEDLATPRGGSVGRLFIEKVESEKTQPLLQSLPGKFSQAKKIPSPLAGEGGPRPDVGRQTTGNSGLTIPPLPSQHLRERSSEKGRGKAADQPKTAAPTPEPVQPSTQKTPIEPEEVHDAVAPPAFKGWSWPTKGKVVSRFVLNSVSGNKGVDIQGALGQPVWAAAPGKVVYSGSGVRGYGNLLIIKHSSNYLSAYAYNQRLLVKEGDNVKAGQAIAEMGKAETGRVLLHFEIRYNGRPVDPLAYLSKAKYSGAPL